MTVRADGLRQLQRDLRELGDDLSDLKDANARVAELVSAEASRRAPKGPTGRLAASVRGNRAAGRATVQAGRASVPYAGPIHYGWPAHGIAAQPFVTDAAQALESEWTAEYLDAVEAELDKLRRTY